MKKNIETRVAETILQQEEEIMVAGHPVKAYPPSVATLILVSEAISHLPRVKMNEEFSVEETLAIAKDCGKIGEIVAILILGAKHLTETIKKPQIVEKRALWGLIRYKSEEVCDVVIDRKAEMAEVLLNDLTPKELFNLTARLLKRQQLADFFGLTTFLIEINLLRETKVV